MTRLNALKQFIISLFVLFICVITSYTVNGQIFDSEQNPPGIKWRQINTPNFQLLYPAELDGEASKMANTLEHLISAVSKSLGKQPRKITVILQNQGVVSNGFVQLAPRR